MSLFDEIIHHTTARCLENSYFLVLEKGQLIIKIGLEFCLLQK